jgi:hypothetical protein
MGAGISCWFDSGEHLRDDGEAADEHVAGAGRVQRPADPGEVLGLRRAYVRAIVSVSHRSASSKLEKR